MKIGMTPERRVQLKIDGGYDKHGDVFVIARPLTGSVSFPVKTFDDAKAREQFIDEFTFFRYGGQCPSLHSVLFASDSFSGEEKSSGTLKGKSYTPDRSKAYVTQLIASGELVVHCTGSWIPPGDRNHHLPWPKPRAEEEFLPVVDHRSYALGPHDGPGYEHPEKTRTMPGGKVVPDSVKPVVTAEARVNGAVFNDVNQTARVGANVNQPTLIADRVAVKSAQSGKVLPNANMGTAHAEVGAIQQAFDAGATAGADMTLTVIGKAVCGFCRGDVAAIAKQADLKSLTVFEEATGNTLFWQPGMKSLKKAK